MPRAIDADDEDDPGNLDDDSDDDDEVSETMQGVVAGRSQYTASFFHKYSGFERRKTSRFQLHATTTSGAQALRSRAAATHKASSKVRAVNDTISQ